MFEKDASDDENVETDFEFSDENIDMNDFDNLSEQSISNEIYKWNEENEENTSCEIKQEGY